MFIRGAVEVVTHKGNDAAAPPWAPELGCVSTSAGELPDECLYGGPICYPFGHLSVGISYPSQVSSQFKIQRGYSTLNSQVHYLVFTWAPDQCTRILVK